jgi:hypothetical protein
VAQTHVRGLTRLWILALQLFEHAALAAVALGALRLRGADWSAGLSRVLITPAFRILCASILCVGLVACVGAVPGQIPTAGAGSVRLASSTPPAGEPGQFVFTGAVTGTSQASQEACVSSGSSFRSFTLTTEGNVSGRSYFLSIGVYPYRGPGAYDLQPLPGRPLDYISTRNPLIDEAPGGYPGFLNFIPKSEPGNAYTSAAESRSSTMEVDASEQAGWVDLQMVSINQSPGTSLHVRVTGHFVCGRGFTP